MRRWLIPTGSRKPIRELYALREASSVEGTPEFHALRLGRKQLTRLSPDLSDGNISLPAFLLGAFWCILTAAAIARRRTRIALDRPLAALWETIGSAGQPPKDNSRSFALSSGIVLLTAWLIVPVVLAVVITTA